MRCLNVKQIIDLFEAGARFECEANPLDRDMIVGLASDYEMNLCEIELAGGGYAILCESALGVGNCHECGEEGILFSGLCESGCQETQV